MHLVVHLLLYTVILLEFILQLALLSLEVALNLLCALLHLGNLLVATVCLAVVLALELDELLFGLKNLLLLNHLTLGLGLL